MAKKEDLFDEIKQNSRKDRKKLENFYDSLLEIADTEDANLLVQLADGISRISDCLNKNTIQMIEVAKLAVKNNLIKLAEETISEEEKSELFEEVEEMRKKQNELKS